MIYLKWETIIVMTVAHKVFQMGAFVYPPTWPCGPIVGLRGLWVGGCAWGEGCEPAGPYGLIKLGERLATFFLCCVPYFIPALPYYSMVEHYLKFEWSVPLRITYCPLQCSIFWVLYIVSLKCHEGESTKKKKEYHTYMMPQNTPTAQAVIY